MKREYNPQEIIERLRDILDNLNYPTFMCDECAWIDHYDSKNDCEAKDKCEGNFCNTCTKDHEHD